MATGVTSEARDAWRGALVAADNLATLIDDAAGAGVEIAFLCPAGHYHRRTVTSLGEVPR